MLSGDCPGLGKLGEVSPLGKYEINVVVEFRGGWSEAESIQFIYPRHLKINCLSFGDTENTPVATALKGK